MEAKGGATGNSRSVLQGRESLTSDPKLLIVRTVMESVVIDLFILDHQCCEDRGLHDPAIQFQGDYRLASGDDEL